MLLQLITLYRLYKSHLECDLMTDDELCSLWDNYVTYVTPENADYQIYDSLESFEPEEIATLGLAPGESITWVMRDPWHTGGLIKFESVTGMIKDVERTMFNGHTLESCLKDLISDLWHHRIDPSDAIDFINCYCMEQVLDVDDENADFDDLQRAYELAGVEDVI